MHKFPEFFKQKLKYIAFLREIVPAMGKNEFCSEQISKQDDLMFYFFEMGFLALGEQQIVPKLMGMYLVGTLWGSFVEIIGDNIELRKRILNSISKLSRCQFQSIKIQSFCLLFNLLDTFIALRSTNAPVIFKSITFSLIENFYDNTTRQFIIQNLSNLFIAE